MSRLATVCVCGGGAYQMVDITPGGMHRKLLFWWGSQHARGFLF